LRHPNAFPSISKHVPPHVPPRVPSPCRPPRGSHRWHHAVPGLGLQPDDVGGPGALGVPTRAALHPVEEDLGLEVRHGVKALLGDAVWGAAGVCGGKGGVTKTKPGSAGGGMLRASPDAPDQAASVPTAPHPGPCFTRQVVTLRGHAEPRCPPCAPGASPQPHAPSPRRSWTQRGSRSSL